jgi:hypothetical protein
MAKGRKRLPFCIRGTFQDFLGQKKTEFDILRLFRTDDEPDSQPESKTEPKTQTTRLEGGGIEEKSQLSQTREVQLQRNDSLIV